MQVNIGAFDQGIDYHPQGLGFLVLLWLVSLLALLVNSVRLLWHKQWHHRHHSWQQLIWTMGRDQAHVSSFFVDRFSRYNHRAKTGAASWRALDLFYHYHSNIQPHLHNDREGRLTRFWIGRMHNRQSVTTRLAMATELLTKALLRYRADPVVRIVSIATGSTEALIQAILRSGVRNVEVVLLDSHADALEALRTRVAEAGLLDCFTFVQGTTRRLDALCVGQPPQIIEMIGFLDYRPEHKAVALLQTIHEGLAPGGTFFTGNIHPNPERIFLDWVLLWPMIYRTADQLADLLIRSDFQSDRIQLFYEPFGIHGIALCRK